MGRTVRLPNDTYIVNDLYSTNEKIIGKWIDNKPIYRKVVKYVNNETIGAANQANRYYIPHGIDNLETVISCKCSIGGTYDSLYFDSDGTKNIIRATWIRRLTSTDIVLEVMNDTWTTRAWYFILEYTKTTD